MRDIKYIAVHCTAGWQTQTIDGLLKEFKAKGWKNPGYHFVVEADGNIVQLLDTEKVSNGVKGYNSISVNVAWMGGIVREGDRVVSVDNRTDAQKASLRKLMRVLRQKYPKAVIQGHRDFSPDKNGNGKIERWEWIKDCPCFDARVEYKDI